jgi:hypothetical protein
VLFYAGDNKKKKINHILWSILKEATPGLKSGSLQGYVQANANSRIAKERILEAVVAAKLAIRTFKLIEQQEEENNAD